MLQSTEQMVLNAIAQGLRPDLAVSFSAWAAEHVRVPDGPREGQRWDPELTPQWVEVLDCLHPDHPCTLVAVRKSAQVGFTMLGLGWTANVIANAAARMLIVQPTVEPGARDFVREKLQPMIDATAALRQRVRGVSRRDEQGSTTFAKLFPGGSLQVTGASSSKGLRSRTVRWVWSDEEDEYPFDLDGQGDPDAMIDARQTAFHASGEYKRLSGSTPTVKDASRVDRKFRRGDQRFWQMPCPHCGHEQRLVWGQVRFDVADPMGTAHYVCAGNGCVIEHREKRGMIAAGRWVASNPDGAYPSFHLDALSSNLTTWGHVAAQFVEAKDDRVKLKAWVNLCLGEVWEERGDAPEVERLMALRDDRRMGSVPAGFGVVTHGVDVQKDGLWHEVLAHGPERRTHSVLVHFLPGDSADPEADCWKRLAALYDATWPVDGGGSLPHDGMAIDCAYNTDAVWRFVRARPKAYAVRGVAGWGKPAIGAPTSGEVSWSGKRKRKGLQVWPVGADMLKATLYADLRKKGPSEGAELPPAGWCSFTLDHDETFFKQLTAESLVNETRGGLVRRVWKANGPNHTLDCRVYAMALAHHLRLPAMDEAAWSRLFEERQIGRADDLVSLAARPVAPAGEAAAPSAPSATAQTAYLGPRRSGWLRK